MDFDRIRQNLRFRSGRSTNLSKRFPTREPEPDMPSQPQQQKQQKKKPAPSKKHNPTHNSDPQRPSTPPNHSINKSQGETNTLVQSPMPDPKLSGSDSEQPDYDLRPPASKPRSTNLETLTDLLFSEGYLRTLTSDPKLLARFTGFLTRFKPELAPLVLQYIDNQKVIKAVEYANAVASSLESKDADTESRSAVELLPSFQKTSQHAFNTLLTAALPAWVTYSLVKTSTSCLTAEITNQATPLTQDLVGGLSEVFCLTDPAQEDNPIVYATEEFYRLTGYGKEAVIGHNCRFLQGSKTQKQSVDRLREAVGKGEEICETLLNHRKDGTPFVNVLMLAPLHDDKGKLKYYLGAQVDASRLVEGGRGVEGFERFLVRQQMEEARGRDKETDQKRMALAKLRDLSMTFDLEESAMVQNHSRSNSTTRVGGDSTAGTDRTPATRRRFDDDDEGSDSDNSADGDDAAWNLSKSTSSGRLPGMYKSYVLIRPHPSLRTIFVSKGAKKLGNLQQRPFLAHIAAPSATLTGLKDALQSGTPVTAKVVLMAQTGESREGKVAGKWGKKDGPADYGKTCWISATPLLDSNDKVGVWMVVIVDKGSVGSNIGQKLDEKLGKENAIKQWAQKSAPRDADVPIKPVLVGPEAGDEEELARKPKSDTNGDVERNGEEQDEGKSKRSAHISNGNGDQDSNSPIIESQPGSPSLSPDISQTRSLHAEQDTEDQENEDATPPSDETIGDSTPKRGSSDTRRSGGAQDVGLRAMDYLTSRSPAAKKEKGNGTVREVEDGDRKVDWNLASPYSVD